MKRPFFTKGICKINGLKLDTIFRDMFNPKQNFEHIDKDKDCRFCD